MTIRKIGEINRDGEKKCNDPEHEPPRNWFPSNGIYEHECPACGKKEIIKIEHLTSFANQKEI